MFLFLVLSWIGYASHEFGHQVGVMNYGRVQSRIALAGVVELLVLGVDLNTLAYM
jgi:hypothetical protein